MRSANSVMYQFNRAVRAQPSSEAFNHYCVALICLTDCKETIDEILRAAPGQVSEGDRGLLRQYEVIYGRLAQICEDLAEKHQGQLKLLA